MSYQIWAVKVQKERKRKQTWDVVSVGTNSLKPNQTNEWINLKLDKIEEKRELLEWKREKRNNMILSLKSNQTNEWINLKLDKTEEKLATLLEWRRDSNTFNQSTVVFSKFWGWSIKEARRSRGREGSRNFGGEHRRSKEEDLGFSEIFNLKHWN